MDNGLGRLLLMQWAATLAAQQPKPGELPSPNPNYPNPCLDQMNNPVCTLLMPKSSISDLADGLGVRHNRDEHGALPEAVSLPGHVAEGKCHMMHHDHSAWLQPPVDSELGCSAILPGQ